MTPKILSEIVDLLDLVVAGQIPIDEFVGRYLYLAEVVSDNQREVADKQPELKATRNGLRQSLEMKLITNMEFDIQSKALFKELYRGALIVPGTPEDQIIFQLHVDVNAYNPDSDRDSYEISEAELIASVKYVRAELKKLGV